jgi:hypothetical protein
MGLSAELHALAALHTKKELLVPIEMDAVWAPNYSGLFGKELNLLLPASN